MNEKYLKASSVEKDIVNLITGAFSDSTKKTRFVKERSFKTMIGQGVRVGKYNSGTIAMNPVEYKGEVCYVIDFSLYDYSMYDISYPYADGISGAYMLDKFGHLLAITEQVTTHLDCFPWTVAHDKCKDKRIKAIIDEPSIFITTAGNAIPASTRTKKVSPAVKYIKRVLGRVEPTTIGMELDVKGNTDKFITALRNGAHAERNLDYIDRDVQDKVDMMEELIDSVNNDTVRSVGFTK